MNGEALAKRICPCTINAIGVTPVALKTRTYRLKSGYSLTQDGWCRVVAILNTKRDFTSIHLSRDLRVVTVSVDNVVAWQEGAHRHNGQLLNSGELVWHLIADQLDLAEMEHHLEMEEAV